MGQLGFFDLNRLYETLTEKNDPLVAIAAMVPFESFRPKLHTACCGADGAAQDSYTQTARPARRQQISSPSCVRHPSDVPASFPSCCSPGWCLRHPALLSHA